jgi:hypothetical protein
MLRGISLTAALLLLAVPAMAQDNCVVPYAPSVPKGETATREQILSTRDLVTAFIKASDDYQRCLLIVVQQEEQAAASEKRAANAVLLASLEAKQAANQREKVRTGEELNAAVRAWNTANTAAQTN